MNKLINKSVKMTFHCISKKYCKLFEKLGWIILMMAKNKQDNSCLAHYLKNINNLIEVTRQKCENTKNLDKQNDLNIIHHNLIILQKHVMKDMKHKNNAILNVNNPKNTIHYDATFCGLNKWHESAFMKLGWMLLAYDMKDMSRVKEYIHMLHKLYAAIELKHKSIHNIDTKHDLEIMLENVKILINHVLNDFK